MFSPALLPTCLFVLIASSQHVVASLHPYKPIKTTIYAAGQPAQVKWLDDGHKPKLAKVGPMRIDLFAGVNTYLTALAQDVKPLSKSKQVQIPTDMGQGLNVSYFIMRFISEKPPLTFYTTGFKITNITITNSSIISATSPSFTASAGAAQTTTHDDPLPLGKGPGAHVYNANQKIDLERAKFRVVFILWPTLIGITMAL